MPPTIVSLGNVGSASAKVSGSGPLSLTCAQAVPAGSLVAVWVGLGNSNVSLESAGVTDSKGNTYVSIGGAHQRLSTPPVQGETFVGVITTALTTSDTISAVWISSVSDVRLISAWGFSGASSVVHAARVTNAGTATTPSVATGTITLAVTLFLGIIVVNGPNTQTFTQDTDTNGGTAFQTATRVGTTGGSATTNWTLNAAYKITSSVFSPQTWNPVLGTSTSWAQGAMVFSPRASAPPEGRFRRNALLRR